MATAQKNESALLAKVWNIANVLSAAGVGFTDYITQLTYILFLKMDDEKETMGLTSYLPDDYKWKKLKSLSGTDLVEKYEKILKELSLCDGLIGTIFTKATNKIYRPVMLKKVIDMVAEDNLAASRCCTRVMFTRLDVTMEETSRFSRMAPTPISESNRLYRIITIR